MPRLNKLIPVLAAIALISFATAARADSPFLGMQNITGNWKLANPENDRAASFRLRYELISKDTALVEYYGDPAKQMTQTLFHPADGELMATHYCGRGNQPRLLAQREESGEVVFSFLDITNLSDSEQPHMVGMRFRFIDENTFEKDETYRVGDKDVTSTVVMIRDE